MNSSIDKTSNNLAPKLAASELLPALKELANVRDDSAAFGRFASQFPGFVRVDERVGPAWASILRVSIPSFLPPEFAHMYRRREALRRIWCGDSEMLAMLLLPEVPPEEASPKEREAYIEKTDPEGRAIELSKPLPLTFDWQRSQITYEPQTEFQSALYALFRQSRLAKVCANPDCPAKYFIARRASQDYCSDGCAKVFQSKWKRQWWAENGKEWRRRNARKKTKRKHGGKR